MSDLPTPQLVLLQPDLAALPEPVLHDGYRLRHYREGDGPAWVAVINDSFGRVDPPDYWHQRMGHDEAFRPERVWFVTAAADLPVGTASAWVHEKYGLTSGVLHMVGVRTDHAGHGLGRAVCLAALGQMKREGRPRAFLSTDDFRLPAIRTYLRLGFEPFLVHENQRERWRRVLAQLDRTGEFEPCLTADLVPPATVGGAQDGE